MAYIGNTAEQQAFTPAIDFFSGNGVTTAFTLSRPVASVAQVQATIENVPQNPGTAFTVSGNTITFDGAPASGTNNIYVYYTSPITQVIQPGQGTVGTAQLANGVLTPTAVSDQLNASTGYFDLPTGTTAQRPASPVVGMVRYNTTQSQYEAYTASGWKIISTTGYDYSIDYLVVAGGGGGGSNQGGGGGAGGLITSTATISPLGVYTITVGAGGGVATNGSNSVISSLATAIGGGRGGSGDNAPAASSGGSGGGGGAQTGSFSGASGTSGQGFAGGSGSSPNGGGGGGATEAGNTDGQREGGDGVVSSITGTSVTYAGGGAGGSNNGSSLAGGAGGGGTGSGSVAAGGAGTANTGGGGGAGGSTAGVGNGSGAAGGSGIVVIRYFGEQKGTGGTVTFNGGFTIHTFTSSGTYTS